MNRRTFLLGSAAVSAGALYSTVGWRRAKDPLTGEILGASDQVGHLLRSGALPSPSAERKVPVLIVGGGISGLFAGWKLAKAGFRDFQILELEAECGGNSRFGENSVTRYPWGAHYVPVPTKESRAVCEFLDECGVIEGADAAGKPIYKEEYLCFSPQERLYIHGRWQEGLLPQIGATRNDLDQYGRFKDLVAEYRHRRGGDGRRAFAIPMELSSRDPDLLALDRLSMREFLLQKGFDSPRLHWYVDYACRDDFGCRHGDVSAWAGMHYFASRDGEGGADDYALLTWPEGNGWLVERLREKLSAEILTNSLVYRLQDQGRSVTADVFDPETRLSSRIVAAHVVFAAPKHTLRFILGERSGSVLADFKYAPWMVANLTLRGFPVPRAGAPIAWDNVIYDSDSLGYVVATHQSLRTRLAETVFTYYYPLAGSSPERERRRLLETPWSAWADLVLRDLAKPHPEIRDLVTRLDVFRWGHAMIRPRPGFIWGEARRRAAVPSGNIYFAHSDLSGFSLFEEAQYRGILAAEQTLDRMRVPYTSSL